MNERQLVGVCPALDLLTIFISFSITPIEMVAVKVSDDNIDATAGDIRGDVKYDGRRFIHRTDRYSLGVDGNDFSVIRIRNRYLVSRQNTALPYWSCGLSAMRVIPEMRGRTREGPR